MDLRDALKEQYHGGLAMLAECVAKCPDELWAAASQPVDDEDRSIIRSFWRIAFHNVYFTHLYLGQNEDAFRAWPGRRPGWYEGMWHKPWDLEPYELPEEAEPYGRQEILDYITYVDSLVDPTIDSLDLDTNESGFFWYKNISKLSHELMNLRHLQGHIGQLSEILMARGIDIDWIAKAASRSRT